MKKNTFTLKEQDDYATSFVATKKIQKKGKKTEHFNVQLSKVDQEKYIESFFKKRILSSWQEQRTSLKTISFVPPSFQKQLYKTTYNQLEPLLLNSYREDFTIPLSTFALLSWLQYVKILSLLAQKHRDTQYWEELSNFIYLCSKFNLL